MPSTVPVVAIFNTSDDTVEMLRVAIERAGFVVVSGHLDDIRRGGLLLKNFVREHNPVVVVYDIAPPYDRNWRFFEHVRDSAIMQDRHFVITSTNPARVHELIGKDALIFEIVGKPYDLDQIVDAVRQASRARPTN